MICRTSITLFTCQKVVLSFRNTSQTSQPEKVMIFHDTIEQSEKDQNRKLQFLQPDYRPRQSPNFRTVFGIMIGPFPTAKLAKHVEHKMRKKKNNIK